MSPKPEVSIVVPMYNEADNVEPLVLAVQDALGPAGIEHEMILVDDGSTDATWQRIIQAAKNPAVRGLCLSRNFGHQGALFAGIHDARGRAVVTMDGDLQHPPGVVPEMVHAWRAGYEIVNTRRIDATDTGFFKQLTSRWFYAAFSRLSRVRMYPGSSDFRLMDEAAAASLKEMTDADLFIRGMVTWIGFRTTIIDFQAAPRYAGRTKFNLGRMLRFSSGAILSFSVVPLKFGIWVGFATSVLAFAEFCYIVYQYLRGVTVPGWASVMTVLSLMFGLLFILIGIIGIYLGKIYEVLKSRPPFIIRERTGATS